MGNRAQIPETPVFRLTVQALPQSVPAVLRLRRLLKTMLRWFGFRCLLAEEIKSPTT